ncbi:MAG: 30S ribosomal protein S6 [Acidobacteria bacterium RIFCSPLOWO2_12_FULL_67_14b]|nr:MAG: 30S ribosomal protein S6 [Acidobacteria bacterium RIFCSPLOWO2_12_FULL_67_14b]
MSKRTYELIYVLKPDAPETEVADMHKQVADIVERLGGAIDKTDTWGRRKLAYEIGHHKEGFYVLEVITGSGELMKEIDRRLKVTEGLLRHLIVRVDESTIKAERMRTKRIDESRRRRVARGLPPDRQPGEGPQGEDSDDSGDLMFDGAETEV